MKFHTRTTFRNLPVTLSYLLAVATMLHGCANAKNGAVTSPEVGIANLSPSSGPLGTQ
jgi:hypothetical protein